MRNSKKLKIPNWNTLAKRYPGPTNMRLPRGARWGTTNVSPPTSLKAWARLTNEVLTIPIYLIACHSALCISYESCKTPSRKQQRLGIPTFRIPSHTYIMNFTSGGEYCLFNASLAIRVKSTATEFRKLLLLNDRADVREGEEAHEHGFVRSVVRAAPDAVYPNISCTFKEDKGDNELGVFNVEETDIFTNEHSLIKHTDPGPYPEDPESWYLDDIINETYKRTKTTRGIFIFSGCTSGFKQAKTKANLNGSAGKAISDAESLIRMADVEYGTKVHGLDREMIESINPTLVPTNFGIRFPVRQIDPTSMAALAAATGETIETLFPNIVEKDPENIKKAKGMLNS